MTASAAYAAAAAGDVATIVVPIAMSPVTTIRRTARARPSWSVRK
jgi:hypothetical protein